jgi:hypothetical protein
MLVAAYDFARFERIVDVGGGHGALLYAILSATPHRYFRPLFLDTAANGRRLDHEGVAPGIVFVRGGSGE